ncbi:MAG TPA: GIY-YIG nuclease family protein [Candidatus Peribacterales bacterium]|nr:GIY-YIG nuclease family protein [Candidatus Peribacterales bacterium]
MSRHKHSYHLYILECEDGTYYTGTTSNLDLRLKQHFEGAGAEYTKEKKPKKLVYSKEFRDIFEARDRERQIKDWSQAKKKKLISGEWS